jgi:glycine/D-amino acid oxidase-like deaminating enzyme
MDLKSGYPFPLIKNGLPFNYPSLSADKKTDVVIIGGGISGALCAYYLSENGFSCILVDGRSIGLGSTCANTSLVQYEIDVPLHKLIELTGYKNAVKAYELCKKSVYDLIAICTKIGFSEIQPKKSLYFAAYKKDIPFLKKEYEARKKNGFKADFLEGKELFSKTNIEAGAGIISEYAAQTDAYLLTHMLHQYNCKNGAEVYDRSCVTGIAKDKNTLQVHLRNKAVIRCRFIVNATGYEVTSFMQKPVVKLQSTYAFITESYNQPPAFWPDELLLWNTANPYLYMRMTTDNRVIVGGRDEDFFSPRKRDKLLPVKTKQLAGDFSKLFPGNRIEHEFSWTGTFGSTKDGLPYIGPAGPDKRILYALGFGGNGITFSVIAGELLAEQLKGIRNKNLELFSFNR